MFEHLYFYLFNLRKHNLLKYLFEILIFKDSSLYLL